MTRVSQRCDCAFCIDANGLRLAQRCGSLDKVLAVATWQEADCFDAMERAALAYADAVSATPPQVSAALKAELRRHFDDCALTELTALVAFQNLSARFNAALDIPAQGLCTPATGRRGTRMLDRYLHPPLKPALARLATGLDRRGVRADGLTLFGFAIGVMAVPLLMWQQYGMALAAVLINRLCDGLDGALARRQGSAMPEGFWISPSIFCFMPWCRWGLCWPIRR